MAKLLKLRRGSTSDHSSFTGAEGEVTVDTTKDALVVHDGSTAGGHPVAKSADLTSYVPLAGGTLTGNIVFDNDNQIQFQEATSNGNAYVGLKAPTDMGSTSSYTVTLPSTAPSTGQVLKTDSSTATQLTWAADTAGLAAPSSAGTVDASKGVQVDANKDVTGFRNVTLTGELDAATGDFSGDVDIDGTCEADAYTVNGTALDTHIAGVTVTNATNSAHVLVTDNESTNEENLIPFVEGATSSTGNVGLEMDGDFAYNPSTGTVTATIFKGNLDSVDIDVDGTANLDAVDIDGDVDLAGDLTFSGAARDIKLLDNTAAALDITESTNSYIKFDTTNGDELITVSKATAGNIYDIGSSPGATITIDFANGNNQKVTLSANFTLANASNQVAGQSGTIFFIQPGGANYSISAIGNNWLWAGGTDGELTATNGAIDRLDYIIQEDGKIHAVISQGMAT